MLLLAACGLVGAAASQAAAQPFLINADGATLLENLFRAPAITNDFIDANLDGLGRRYGGANQNLSSQAAPNAIAPYFNPGVWWILDYCAIGSVNGVQELVDLGRTYSTVNGANLDLRIPALSRERAFWNNVTQYINAGVSNNAIYNGMNPGGKPVRSSMDGAFTAMYAGDEIPSPGGITNDLAPVDVPTIWAVQTIGGGSSDPTDLPNGSGYGTNPYLALNKDGTVFLDGNNNTFGYKLVDTAAGNVTLFQLLPDPTTADQNTIFDTRFTFAPIAPITNFGTGRQTITFTTQRHMLVTGRTESGENLMQVTRDVGSGTHNGFVNSVCVDPSWGMGEAIGGLSTLSELNLIGPFFQPSNKGGSGAMEGTFLNHRLSIGYTGGERGIGATGWLQTGRNEILGIRNDMDILSPAGPDGTDFVRPTIDAILDNGYRGQIDPSTGVAYTVDGWTLGGEAVLATFGDPRANSANKGGLGFGERFIDANSNGRFDAGEVFFESATDIFSTVNGVRDEVEARPADANLNPSMRNQEAAALINNTSRSLDFFSTNFVNNANVFSPAEFIATRFIPLRSRDRQQGLFDPCAGELNAARLQSLQDFVRNPGAFVPGATQVYADSRFVAFGNATNIGGSAAGSRAGKVPVRQPDDTIGAGGAAVRYSDNSSNPIDPPVTGYLAQGGAIIGGGANLSLRNLVAGDFNADGLRNSDDSVQLILAWDSRNGATAWVSPSAVNDPGRSDDLTDISAASGMPVNAADASIEILGDFDGDGNFGRKWNTTTQTFGPDRSDVRYWADGLALDPVTGKLDRSAGFLKVDQAWVGIPAHAGDTDGFFNTTLATGVAYELGDAVADISGPTAQQTPGFAPNSMDGTVSGFDIDYVYRQFLRNPRVTDGALNWANLNEAAATGQFRPDLSADINGDLIINQADVDRIVFDILETSYGDVDLDGDCDKDDLSIANGNINLPGGWAQGDVNGDGTVTAADIAIISGCINVCPCDVNHDGMVTSQDFFDFLTGFFGGTLDYNHDGMVTSQDFFDFLSCFFNAPPGCN